MKIVLYGLLLLVVWLLPSIGTDVGELIPVEVLAISENGGAIMVRTDTGDMGSAGTLDGAFANLKEAAPGIIYLDTAEYLLLEPGMEQYMSALRGNMKSGIKVCLAKEGIPLDGISDFLSAHDPGVKLKQVAKDAVIPTISEENNKFEIN